jgi:CRP/FNR family cyclic AMP-dependent transcriptional regulator
MASTPQASEALSKLGDFSEEDKARIVAAGTLINIPANWSVIFEGTPADKAYIILDGHVSVRHGATEIAQLGAGEVIGEVALVKHQLRAASVITMTQVKALHFTAAAVAELSATVPAFGAALRATADERTSD